MRVITFDFLSNRRPRILGKYRPRRRYVLGLISRTRNPASFALGSRSPDHSSGFTLLELMVVLAIAALVLTITPPLFTAAVPGVELKASARRVMAGLRLARELAIRNGRDITFILDVEARTFEVGDESRSGKPGKDLELRLEAAETEQLGEHRGAVRFFPDGSSTGGRIVLARKGRGYQVGVQWLTGRVLMASWKAE